MRDDHREIEKLVQEYADACTAGDLERWSEVLAEGAVFHPPDLPEMNGKEAVVQWAKEGWFDPLDMTVTLDLTELEVTGAWAFGTGGFTVEAAPKSEADSFAVQGTFLAVYQRGADDRWRYARTSFNFNAPFEAAG